VVASFPEMLQKTDDYAVELSRPYQDIIIRPSLFNWKLNEKVQFVPSRAALQNMTLSELRGLKLSAIQSAKGFEELAHLSFIFE